MHTLLKVSLAAIISSMPVGAMAQEVDYPVDSVRIFVPGSPGGGTDATARMFAQFAEKHSDASFAIVNQTVGGGVVAAQTVSEGAKDGSILFFFHAALHTANEFGQSPFSADSFSALATISEYNDVYAVRADAPFETVAELVSYAEEHPGELNIGSQLGGTTQVKGQALNNAAGGNMRLVDAGTESDRITALLGEQVDVISMGVANARQYVADGQIKVLALLNNNLDPAAPEFPTAASQGVNISFPLVMTVYGPADVDQAVIDAFEELISAMESDPEFADAVTNQSQALALRGPSDAHPYIQSEQDMVAEMLAD